MGKFTNPKTLKGQDKVNRMKDLMKRMNTLNESTSLSEIDFIKKGPNGVVYGIIRENHDYFIKTTDKTSNTIVAEDFNYIGGLQNKYDERYKTYAEALKQLNMKFDMLNDSYGNETGSNLFESDAVEVKEANASGLVKIKEEEIDEPLEVGDENTEDKKIVLDEEPEDVDEQKKVIKVDAPAPAPAPVEDEVEVDEFAVDDSGTEEFGTEEEVEVEDDGDEITKKIQKLTGKVAQLMRDIDEPDSELDKYVINSIISAVDFEEMDDEDVEDIIAKIEGEDEEAGEGDEFGTGEDEVDVDVDEVPEGEPTEELAEDSEGEETYNYGEDEGADEKKLKKLKKKKQTKDTKSHEIALDKDEEYDEDHEDREEKGTNFSEQKNESKTFSKKQLMETFLKKNVNNSLKKVLKENRTICEVCLGEGCPSCMNEHHPMDATKEIGGKYNRNEYIVEDDDMDMLSGDDVGVVDEDIDDTHTQMLGQDVLYSTGDLDRDDDDIPNRLDLDNNDDGSLDYGMGNKMYDWPERIFGRKGDRDSDGIPNIDDIDPATPSWDEEDDFIEIDFESLMGNAPVKDPDVKPPKTTPGTKQGKPRWKNIPRPNKDPRPKGVKESKKKSSVKRKGIYK